MIRNALSAAILLAAVAASADSAKGKKLNAEGYELYKKGDFEHAADAFEAAVEAAPRLAIAHYNLAATKSRIGNGCLAKRADILRALKASIALDPSRLERARVDPDFAYVRRTVGFQRLLGAELTTAAGLTALLPTVDFQPPTDCGSDMGCGFEMKFLPGGVFERSEREEGGWEWKRRLGTWRVKERTASGSTLLDIEIDVPAKFGFKAIRDTAQLLEDGRLLLNSHWLTDEDGCG